MGFIYKITNIINNDFYVGQTKGKLNRRFSSHICKSKNNKTNNKFHNAITKYGKNNFIIEVVEEVENTLLDEKEVYYIDLLKPQYNTLPGGKSTIGFSGKKLSVEHAKKIRDSVIKPYYQYNLKGEFLEKFESLRDVLLKYPCCKRTIGNCARKEQKSSCGFFWSFNFLGDTISNFSYSKKTKAKKIIQLTLDDKEIKVWNSMAEIEKELNISTSKICLCCQNKRKYTKGFKFKYYE